MRRAHVLTALTLAASCGGSPTRPTQSVSPALPAGSYTLTLSSPVVETCQNGFCTSVTICIGPANVPPIGSVPVTVSRDGDRATVVPVAAGDSLRMTLTLSGAAVTGSVSGTATASSGAAMTASGTLAGVLSSIQSGLAQGMLDGDLTISGATCSGTTKNWALAPR
jgi:hypothetical protein